MRIAIAGGGGLKVRHGVDRGSELDARRVVSLGGRHAIQVGKIAQLLLELWLKLGGSGALAEGHGKVDGLLGIRRIVGGCRGCLRRPHRLRGVGHFLLLRRRLLRYGSRRCGALAERPSRRGRLLRTERVIGCVVVRVGRATRSALAAVGNVRARDARRHAHRAGWRRDRHQRHRSSGHGVEGLLELLGGRHLFDRGTASGAETSLLGQLLTALLALHVGSLP